MSEYYKQSEYWFWKRKGRRFQVFDWRLKVWTWDQPSKTIRRNPRSCALEFALLLGDF